MNSTMQGNLSVPFSELIGDTIKTHGVVWAWRYYGKRGMRKEEFRIWAKAAVLKG